MKTVLLASVFAIGISGAAFAQSAALFADVDADGSGAASLAEVQTAWPGLTEAAFTAADTDGSGDLSQSEYDTLAALSVGASVEGSTAIPQ
jgi:hypothetical protein